MTKICYTANFGAYDVLLPPTEVTPGWRYYCYTDQPETVPQPYVPIQLSKYGPKYDARMVKCMAPGLPDCSTVVWHDASIQVQCDLNKFVAEYHTEPITVMRHPARTTVQQECEAVVALGKDVADNVRKVQQYLSENPVETALVATGLMIRDHNNFDVDASMLTWWQMILEFSVRDQLTFNLAMQNEQQPFGYMPYNLIEGNGFQWKPHTPKP